MSELTPDTPKRANVATLLQMLHEERMAFAQRRSENGGYTVDLKRGNSSTNMGVIAIDLHGAQREGQTADEFVKEHAELFESLCARFPLISPSRTRPASVYSDEESNA